MKSNKSQVMLARIAGALILFIAIAAPFGMMYVPSQLIAAGDGAATASRILASEGLFRASLITDMLVALSEVVLTAVLYVLFRPVSPVMSLATAFARLSMTVVQGVNLLLHGAVLSLLKGASGSQTSFSSEQLHSLVLFVLESHHIGVLVWEAFFSLHCALLAWLIYKSGVPPKLLGLLMAIAALGYGVNSFGGLLAPEYAKAYAALVGVGAIVGEVPFMLWLLAQGISNGGDPD